MSPSMTAEAAANPLLVLVVDDNEVNRLLLSRAVEAFGASVRTAENGREALEKIKHEPFSLVFMDIAMPVLDGIEATKAVRASGDDVPVVAVTANYGRGDEAGLKEVGFNGLIPKPFDLTEVYEQLAKLR
jgi:CheY-like chemotaxis protein